MRRDWIEDWLFTLETVAPVVDESALVAGRRARTDRRWA